MMELRDIFIFIFAVVLLGTLASIDRSLKEIADKEFITYDTEATG